MDAEADGVSPLPGLAFVGTLDDEDEVVLEEEQVVEAGDETTGTGAALVPLDGCLMVVVVDIRLPFDGLDCMADSDLVPVGCSIEIFTGVATRFFNGFFPVVDKDVDDDNDDGVWLP